MNKRWRVVNFGHRSDGTVKIEELDDDVHYAFVGMIHFGLTMVVFQSDTFIVRYWDGAVVNAAPEFIGHTQIAVLCDT